MARWPGPAGCGCFPVIIIAVLVGAALLLLTACDDKPAVVRWHQRPAVATAPELQQRDDNIFSGRPLDQPPVEQRQERFPPIGEHDSLVDQMEREQAERDRALNKRLNICRGC